MSIDVKSIARRKDEVDQIDPTAKSQAVRQMEPSDAPPGSLHGEAEYVFEEPADHKRPHPDRRSERGYGVTMQGDMVEPARRFPKHVSTLCGPRTRNLKKTPKQDFLPSTGVTTQYTVRNTSTPVLDMQFGTKPDSSFYLLMSSWQFL